MRPSRRAAHLRRGDHRIRPVGHVVRGRALRRHAGHDHVCQGGDVGLSADRRRHRRHGGSGTARIRRVVPAPSRLHVLRPRVIVRRRAGEPGHPARGGAARAGRTDGSAARRWVPFARGRRGDRPRPRRRRGVGRRAATRSGRHGSPRPHARQRRDHAGDRHRHVHVLPAARHHRRRDRPHRRRRRGRDNLEVDLILGVVAEQPPGGSDRVRGWPASRWPLRRGRPRRDGGRSSPVVRS